MKSYERRNIAVVSIDLSMKSKKLGKMIEKLRFSFDNSISDASSWVNLSA
jgi:hypothetical protein